MIERPVKLTIRAIQAVPLVAPLGRVFRGSNYQMTKRCTVITRVLTAEGIVGESYNGDEEGDAQVRLVRTITGTLAPLLTGQDAAMVEACWQAMLPITYDILGDRALAMKAIACVDSALWDALGKSLGAPLFKIWGGFRTELPIVAIGGSPPVFQSRQDRASYHAPALVTSWLTVRSTSAISTRRGEVDPRSGGASPAWR